MYRIRLHGRGGQGIKSAGRVLGTAFFLAGYEVQDAPLYGAERRGAPILSCVRAGRESVRERGLVMHPDLVVVADETLMNAPAANVLQGVDAHTVLLISGDTACETWRTRLNRFKAIVTLPAAPAEDSNQRWLVGASCAGGAAGLTGVISREVLSRALSEELGEHGATAMRTTRRHALAAYEAVANHAGIVEPGPSADASRYEAPDWLDLPMEAARVSAPDIFAPATSSGSHTGQWRTERPLVDYGRCNRCTWICSTFCPDSAIAVRADGAPEIDLDHCKGCLICVSVCPPRAIRAVSETATTSLRPAGGAS